MKLRFSWEALASHAALLALAAYVQSMTHIWTDHKAQAQTLDGAALAILALFVPALLLLGAGDRLARMRGWWKQGPYLAIGAVSGAVVQALAVGPAGFAAATRSGIVVIIVAVHLTIGALVGYLLRRALGFSIEGDDPAELEQTAGSAGDGAASARYDTSAATYYGGPLQVRSSAAAALVAAIIAAFLFAVLSFFSPAMRDLIREGMAPPLFRANPVMAIIYGAVGWTLPYYFFVRRAHGFLQRRGKAEQTSYLWAGAIVPAALTFPMMLALGPIALLITLQFVVPSVIAMAIYHRMAGMEPLDLPDDIEVRDARTMLSVDHIRRRTRRAIVQ